MLSFREFSKQIIETGDIDPDYILIRKKCKEYGWGKKQMFNWILHKLVIYDSYSELQVIKKEKDIFDVKYGTERRKSKRLCT
jgi:phage antirepressor YoqD-like protein